MKANSLISRIATVLFLCSFLAVLVYPQGVFAQSIYSTNGKNAGTVKVSGTSDLQEWSLTSAATESQGLFVFNHKNQLLSVTSLRFIVKTETLKSGLKAMDNKAYKTLKSKKFPNILFSLDSAVVVAGQTEQYIIKAKGSLTIKGVTQTISLNMVAKVNPNGSITLQGDKDLWFSDFNIKVPSFMGGVMQAGDKLVIAVALTYSLQPQQAVATAK